MEIRTFFKVFNETFNPKCYFFQNTENYCRIFFKDTLTKNHEILVKYFKDLLTENRSFKKYFSRKFVNRNF